MAIRRHETMCSLNLVCYRAGVSGCKIVQIQVAKAVRFEDDMAFKEALSKRPDFIVTDLQFFEALENAYSHKMGNIWQRTFLPENPPRLVTSFGKSSFLRH